MVIPVGPPGAQHILMVKTVGPEDASKVMRSDIFGGKIIPFMPLAVGPSLE
jgi:hypothetical protein